MGKTCKINESQKQEIIELYTSGKISNKNKLGSLFNTSKKKITQFLVEAGVDLTPKVKEEKLTYNEWMDLFESKLSENECYIAVCKETDKEFSDYSNISGALSKHILSLHPDVDVPSSFLRRSYVVKNDKFWHADYFIIKKQLKPIKEVKKIPIDEIIKLYTTKEVQSTHRLGEMFNLGHKRISQILRDNGVVMNKRGAQIQTGLSVFIEESKVNLYTTVDEDKKLVAVCKKTGIRFDDVNNLSGFLTRHIIENFGEVPIPTNTYQRKKYEAENGKKWFEEYFDIIEINTDETRKCCLCDWETIDILNKTGCFEVHLQSIHNLSIQEYLSKFPEDIEYHSIHQKEEERNQLLLDENEGVICLECNTKFIGITNSHMKYKHSMTIDDYKLKWGSRAKIISTKMSDTLSLQAIEINKNMIPVFTSKPQIEIKEFIESFGIQVLNNHKKTFNGVEVDLFIPSLNIGIEYNGLYWHCEKMGKHKFYHVNKTIIAEEKGVKLIQIFEDEWRDKRNIVEMRLKHILGLNEVKIYARKCIIKEIEPKVKNEYLERVHLQGGDNSNVKLGAFYDNKLVGVMTFAKPRKSMGYSGDYTDIYELVRYANDGVVGLAGKLLKYFIKNYNPIKIITYADRRWSPVNDMNILYSKLGFEYIGETQPNYWYTKSFRTREHRFKFRKNVLVAEGFDVNKTEHQIMMERGYNKIWDCGSYKYELNIDKQFNEGL